MGAFIGYVTNYLAVKMLFRPFEEKRIFGLRVPFTPGLIPKRRKDIAFSIAKVIEEHLLTPEKLHSLFEETRYRERLKNRIENVFDELVEQIVFSIRENIKEGISIGKFSVKTAVFATALEKLIEKATDRIKERLKEKLLERASVSIERNIEEELPQVLSELNVEKLVVETFLEMDIQTLEKVVLGFSEKQLKHITYTGAVLGFLIGLLQNITLFLN
ncbi:MAG: DUF445 family protein [Persephonella sp.]|nr:DUF445 family protein [Persephonella sp.]